VACLRSHKGAAYRAECIAHELGVAMDSVYEVMRRFAWLSLAGIVKRRGLCKECGRRRVVLRAVSQPMWIIN
jgi:hypothetical protein